MIWLWSNLWWLGPGVVLAAGLAHPIPRALLRRVPVRAWAILGVLALFGLTFQCGRWYERSVAKEAAAAAEKKADTKAAGVAQKAAAVAKKDGDTIRKENADAVTEVRTIIRTVPGACPPLPDRVHDLGRAAVEAARRELPADAPGSP